MNLRSLLSILLSFLFSFSQAQEFYFSENQNIEGFEIVFSKENVIRINYHIHQFNLSPIDIEGKQMQKLNHGLSLISGTTGSPDLPFIGANILIPNDAEVEIILLSSDKEVYSNINISPSAAIPFDTQNSIPAIKGNQYNINTFYPKEKIQLKTTEIRGMNIARIGISPFQYNPITKELIAFKNLEFELRITSSKGAYGNDRFRSPFWDQILSDLVINTEDIPIIDYQKRNTNTKDEGCEYLIVIPNNPIFKKWADTIKHFRNEQGIHTKIVSITNIGGNNINIIDQYFEDIYANWDPVPSAVLLMADYGTNDNAIVSKKYPHPHSGVFISDNHFADATGNDLPDFVFARMTARNSEELENMVGKFIDYERNPPLQASFYNEPITALGWQTERWFQLCSETIGGYMRHVLKKQPKRINAVYAGNPEEDFWSTANGTYAILKEFGPSGLAYIPHTPKQLGNWTDGTSKDIVLAMNSGAFILQHRDHGNYSGWGEPRFSTSSIDKLNNKDLLSHVFSINCLTGQFDKGENCFAEKFHRKIDGGALSITAPTQISYSFVNDVYVWGMYDNMWSDFMPNYGGNLIQSRDFRPAFGSASGKYFLSTSNWAAESRKILTYRLYHHHGDAFSIVYTEVPKKNLVSYQTQINKNTTAIDFNAQAYSLIGLSINGKFIAQGICDENGDVKINIPTQIANTIIKVVVTKQNYFRYHGNIQVIDSDGAYIVAKKVTINDANANSNGIIEYDEEISLDVSIENIGNELTNDIVLELSCEDEYISIIDAQETVNTMNPAEIRNLDKAFTLKVSENIPDEHILTFLLSIKNGSTTRKKSFLFYAYAPNLEMSDFSIAEVNGNGNSLFDPGETIKLTFEMTNSGHVSFPSGNNTLSSNSIDVSITNPSLNYNAIPMGEETLFTYEINSSASMLPYTIVNFTQDLTANPYTIERNLDVYYGFNIENWESGGFNSFNWKLTGNKQWKIATDNVKEGDYSIKIDNLQQYQDASIQLDYNALGGYNISFFCKTDIQEESDIFSFYIDNSIMGTWSGKTDYAQHTFPVLPGEHTFKWTLEKNGSGNSNTVWLDYIVFPPDQVVSGIQQSESLSKHLYVYPNPANDYIYIIADENTFEKLEIINTQGNIIYSNSINNHIKLNISNYKSGIYLVKLQTAKRELEFYRFIKL